MMKKTKLIKVYLGGSHLDTTGWRNEFQQVVQDLALRTGVQLQGIDPFDRKIDESDNKAIIRNDLALLHDDSLQFVVLKSLDHMGNLSTGTACEMMLAHSMNKAVVVLLEPTPLDEPRWCHPFVEHYADHITDSLANAVQWIYDHQTRDSGIQEACYVGQR